METNKSDEIKKVLLSNLKSVLKDKVENICICESRNEPSVTVSIEFEAYRYFVVRLTYDRGSLGCAIINGKYGIAIESSEQWYEKADLSKFFNDIMDDLELRIPNKYLEKNNWN